MEPDDNFAQSVTAINRKAFDAWDAVAAAGQIYNTYVQSKVAKENTDKTILANKNMAEYQYSKDLEMWNAQNNYNSPKEQMARFKNAGLNPNLIYGSSANTGNASTMPKYNAPTLQYNYKPKVDPTQVIGMFQDFTMRQAQINNVKEETRTKKIGNDLFMYNIYQGKPGMEIEKLSNEIKKTQYDADKAEMDVQLKKWEQSFKEMYGPAWGNAIQLLKTLFGR